MLGLALGQLVVGPLSEPTDGGVRARPPNTTALSLAHQARAAGSASALLGRGQGLLGAAVMPLAGIGGATTAVPMGALIAVCSVGPLAAYALYGRPLVTSPHGSDGPSRRPSS